MGLLEILKTGYNRYLNLVLTKYEEGYIPRVLSNHNTNSKYYIIKLAEVKKDDEKEEVVPYVYKDKYMCMSPELDFKLFAINTNGILTELFSGTPVAISYNQPQNFVDISLEDLEEMKSNKCFYAYGLEEISKKEMEKELKNLMNYHMSKYYNEIFKSESYKQKFIIDELIETKKTEKVIRK